MIHMADFETIKAEHITLTPEEQEFNKLKPIIWPINCYIVLVQHPILGNILLDTGVDSGWTYRWPKVMLESYPMLRHYDLKDKVRELDLTVDDIDLLILSHMHFDHAGNLRMFRGTKAGKAVFVQEEEAKNAFFLGNKDDPALKLYTEVYLCHEYSGLDCIGYRIIKGDVKFADNLELIFLSGHTPGTMGMVVRTENNGTLIFPADAVYNSINYGPPLSCQVCAPIRMHIAAV